MGKKVADFSDSVKMFLKILERSSGHAESAGLTTLIPEAAEILILAPEALMR